MLIAAAGIEPHSKKVGKSLLARRLRGKSTAELLRREWRHEAEVALARLGKQPVRYTSSEEQRRHDSAKYAPLQQPVKPVASSQVQMKSVLGKRVRYADDVDGHLHQPRRIVVPSGKTAPDVTCPASPEFDHAFMAAIEDLLASPGDEQARQ